MNSITISLDRTPSRSFQRADRRVMTNVRGIIDTLRPARWLAVLSVAILALLAPSARAGGSIAGESRTASKPMRIVVTIPPLGELARRLAPAGSDVRVLMQPGRSEHGYEYTPSDLAALGRADVVVYVGLGLEPQIEKFLADRTSPTRRDVCFATAVGITVSNPDPKNHDHDHAHEGHDHGEHAHDHEDHAGHNHAPGEACEHDHGGVDPHLWLDPALVKRLVPVLSGAIGASMKSAGTDAPEAVAALIKAEEELIRDIDRLDAEFRAALEAVKGATIVTHHNAWPRLAERYGLSVAAVIRPVESAEPTPGQLAAAVEAIRERKARAIFVEPQFNADAARRLAQAAGVRVGMLDPLGTGEWFGLMRYNLDELVRGLGAGSVRPSDAGAK
jgi:zinc transport system substrate-binding protein